MCARHTSAFDGDNTCPNRDVNMEQTTADFRWVELSEESVALFDTSQFGLAADKWLEAFEQAQGFQGNDPRRAGSRSNLAIAHRIRGEFALAEQCYRQALENWQATQAWLIEMQLPVRARSSLFHLRMESKHREQYNQTAMQKYEKLLPAGAAGTRNNLAELCQITDRLGEAKRLYGEALDERVSSMGEKDVAVAIIRRNIASMTNGNGDEGSITHSAREPDDGSVFSAQATGKRWIVDRPAEFTDEGRRMAALLLTQVIDHSLLAKL